MRRKIDTSVLEIISASETRDNVLILPPRQLERTVYLNVASVLEACGGKWTRKVKGFLFDRDAGEALEDLLLTGDVERIVTKRQRLGQFDTPPELARHMVEKAGVRPGWSVLEPSMGVGRIARAIGDAGGTVFGFEIDPDRADKARHECGHVAQCTVADFLAFPAPAQPLAAFDACLMNPPFGRRAEISHVLHALKFISPGSPLIAVMPAGVSFRSDKLSAAFRDTVYDHHGTIEPLPEGTFSDEGTEIRTVLVSMVA